MGYTSNGPDNESGFYSFEVYELRTPVDKVYIGYTHHTAYKRFKQHIKNSRKTKGKCPAIEGAIRKYGFENIAVTTLMKCWSQYDAGRWETNIIAEMKSTEEYFGYNLTLGGDGGPPNAATLEKLRQSQLNRPPRELIGPTAASAEEIENAIEEVKKEFGINSTKRFISIKAAEKLDVSCSVIKDHMKRIGQQYQDGRSYCSDEQIEREIDWVMSINFSGLMRRTLVEELVGNIFGSGRSLVQSYWKRTDSKPKTERRIFTPDELDMAYSYAMSYWDYNPPSRRSTASIIAEILNVSITTVYNYM
jgi:hypothetical protein